MMVNTKEVRSLLLRLGSELHAMSETRTPDKMTLFASSLSAEIDRTETAASGDGGKSADPKILKTIVPAQSSQTAQAQTLSPLCMSTDLVFDEAKGPERISNAGNLAAQGVQHILPKKTDIQLEQATSLDKSPEEVNVASNVLRPAKHDSSNTAHIPAEKGHRSSLLNELKTKPTSHSKELNAKNSGSVGADVPLTQPVNVTSQSVPENALATGNVPAPSQAHGAAEGISEDARDAKAEGKIVGARSSVGSTSGRMTSAARKPGQPLQVNVESKVEQKTDVGEFESPRVLVTADPEATTLLKKPMTSSITNEVAVGFPQPLLHGLHPSSSDTAKSTSGNITELPRHTESKSISVMLRGVASASDRMTAATPSTLEVGVANGSHGWVRIRAELTDSGEVKASLASNSAAGEGMLHRELPALSSFLHEEKLPVASIVVHQASAGDFSANTGDRGGSGYFRQQSSPDSPAGLETSPAMDQQAETNFGDGGGELITQRIGSNAGGWLSVRA